MKSTMKTLAQVKTGSFCKIKRIHAAEIKAQTIRFGLTEGKEVLCQTIIPGGPVVIKVNQQEIALGRKLALQIEIEEVCHA